MRIDPEVDLDLAASAPLEPPFRVTWTGGLLAPAFGPYVIEVEAPGTCALSLDGQTLAAGAGRQRREAQLAQGVHVLRLDCQIESAGIVQLRWQPPGSDVLDTVPGDTLYRPVWAGSGLVGRFYANDSWSGEAALVRVDRQLGHYFHFLLLPRPYTVEWRGRLLAPYSGVYKLAVKSISQASVEVDGTTVIAPSAQAEEELYLAAGMHELSVRYLDNAPHSQVYLYWKPPEGELALVPPEVLYLPQEGGWW